MNLHVIDRSIITTWKSVTPYYPDGTIPLMDQTVSMEGIIDKIKEWWAERKRKARAEKLQKSKIETKAYIAKMFGDYQTYVLGEDRDIIVVPPIEELNRYFVNLAGIMKALFAHDIRKDTSKTDLDTLIIKSDKIKSVIKNSDGSLYIKVPLKKEAKYAASGWSKRPAVESLRKVLEAADDETWKYYENNEKIITSLEDILNNLPVEKRRRYYGIATGYLDDLDWISRCINLCMRLTFTSMYAISRAT